MDQVQISLSDKMMVLTAVGEHEIKIQSGNLMVYDRSRSGERNGLVAAYPAGAWFGAFVLDRKESVD